MREVRGGLALDVSSWASASGSSPHSRGSGRPVRSGVRRRGFIPAFAGVCSSAVPPADEKRVHPRIRGGLPSICVSFNYEMYLLIGRCSKD